MKQQDLFAHFQCRKKITESIKKASPSLPNQLISTPKRVPVPEVYSKTFDKSKASLKLTESNTILSTTTTELLAQLKSQQLNNRHQTQKSPQLQQQQQNNNSLRERYQELLQDKLELILPIHYKHLLTLFTAIEDSIQLCMMRGETPWSSSICEYVQRNSAVKFSLEKLQQIITVMGNSYKVKWAVNEKKQNQSAIELIITPENDGSSSTREERRKSFKNALLSIVKQHHSEFIQTLPVTEQSMFTDDCWHPKFQVHNVPSIPLTPLPEKLIKSQSKHYQSVGEFIKANEIKNTKVKEILESAAKAQQNKENLNQDNQQETLQQKSLGLSDALIAKIKEKERLLAQQKQLQQESKPSTGQFQHSDKERLKNVASIIKTYATMRRVSNIFYVQVIDHIIQANKKYLISKGFFLIKNFIFIIDHVSQIIEKLISICPQWLQIINHSQGKILRIEQKDISQILSQIEQYK